MGAALCWELELFIFLLLALLMEIELELLLLLFMGWLLFWDFIMESSMCIFLSI